MTTPRTVKLLAVIGVLWGAPSARDADAQLIDFFRPWEDSEITEVLQNAKSARDKAGAVAGKTSGVDGIVALARDNFDALGQDLLEAVEDVRSDGAALLAQELEAAREFAADCSPGSTCDTFRVDLLTLLRDLAEIYNTLVELDEVSAPPALQVDFARAEQAVQRAPALALYPLFVAMSSTASSFGNGILALTSRLKEDLAVARAALSFENPLSQPSRRSAAARAIDLPSKESCDYVLAVPNAVRAASFSLLSTAIALKMIGKVLDARGETDAFGRTKVGVHGYALMVFTDNRQKKFGTYIGAVADMVGKASAAVDNKLVYCAAVGQRANVLQALEDSAFPSTRRRRSGAGAG